MKIIPLALVLGAANGFLPRAPFAVSSTHHQQNVPVTSDSSASSSSLSAPVSTSTNRQSALFEGKLWDRLQIEEDEEPMWYLLNCVAGLEIDLLRQCRQRCEGMEDVVKFAVPTEKKTRSHGANRMVTETKVKYLGYVFAKLRLCPKTYEAIQELDLCRSWMGTVNHSGYKKLPPAPVALNYDEIENFGLEEWEDEEEQEEALAEDGVILDSEEQSERDRKKMAVDEEAIKVYEGFKVEDMVKVTAKNKFHGEDGIVKRLKDGMLKIRFFTYGTTFDEWLQPSEVRQLTADELEKGLGGPSEPITQRDFDGPDEREGYGYGGSRRNLADRFGDGPRNRRQDRTTQGYARGSEGERVQNEKNWNWYQENQRRGQNNRNRYNEIEGDLEFEGASNEGNWAERDVDSQWGRSSNNNNSRASQRQNRKLKKENKQEDDWSAFVSPSSGSKKQVSKEETDDFFSSLMSDLSKDLDSKGSSSDSTSTLGDDDDFFSSLMSDMDDESSTSSPTMNENEEDDFFDSLEADLDSTLSNNEESGSSSDDDDFFAQLEADIRTKDKTKQQPVAKSQQSLEDDFFDSLEADLATTASSSDEDPEDFFANLNAELDADLESLGVDHSDVEEAPQAKSAPKSSPSPSASAPTELSKCTVPVLKEMLKERGLKVSGKKAELIDRLSQVI